MPLTPLSNRQEYLLNLIIHDYIQLSEPIGSKYLVTAHRLGISSATVRNEMAMLEEYGYLASPHTSAGRIPTQDGYRYFVKRLLGQSELSLAEKRTIRHQFHQVRLNVEHWMRLAATVLARSTHSASLITAPHTDTNRFKHLELISTQGRLVLMVLVMHSGDVRQQMLTLAESVSQEVLSHAANLLNAQCENRTAKQIRAKAAHLPLLEQEVALLAADTIESTNALPAHTIYSEGLSTLLPEFAESSGMQQALHIIEERSLLSNVLAEALAPNNIGGVQVIIAGEGRWEELDQCSMVLSRYGVSGQVTGALGVLGPIRMHYGQSINAVRYVAGLMSGLLIDLYGVQEDDAE